LRFCWRTCSRRSESQRSGRCQLLRAYKGLTGNQFAIDAHLVRVTFIAATALRRRRPACFLNRRARDGSVRTENAAIPFLWSKPRPARGAFIEEPAGIPWHDLGLCRPAIRACNDGTIDHARPILPCASLLTLHEPPPRTQNFAQ
jgi:hypothetical protein